MIRPTGRSRDNWSSERRNEKKKEAAYNQQGQCVPSFPHISRILTFSYFHVHQFGPRESSTIVPVQHRSSKSSPQHWSRLKIGFFLLTMKFHEFHDLFPIDSTVYYLHTWSTQDTLRENRARCHLLGYEPSFSLSLSLSLSHSLTMHWNHQIPMITAGGETNVGGPRVRARTASSIEEERRRGTEKK